MKIEIEVRAFGKDDMQGTVDAYKSTELVRVHKLSKDTTLAQIESLLTTLFKDI